MVHNMYYSWVQLIELFELKIVIIFLATHLNVCFWFSKEPSHRGGSFEYPQHMFSSRNKKIDFQLPTIIWGHDYCIRFVQHAFNRHFSI